MSLPHAVAHAVAHDRPLRLTRRSLDAGGDFVSAPDLADAAVRLLEASGPRHFAYNVAGGRFTTVRELLALATQTAPGLRCELAEAADASAVDLDPTDRLARFNAYSIERIAADCGWRPRPLAEQLHAYLRWVADDPRARVLAG
jgi:nucleoside-diphosphate-sugar epimerase